MSPSLVIRCIAMSRVAGAMLAFFMMAATGACNSTRTSDVAAVPERTVHEVSFPARDGRLLKAVISMPAGSGPFPVLVALHGGQGDRGYDVLRNVADPASDSPTVRMLNRNNWIIIAPGYRNAWFGPEETDVVDAIRFGASLPEADLRRVGVLGGSNGGRLALRAAVLDPGLMQCVGAGSPFLSHPPAFFGDKSAPPWSLISPAAEAWMSPTRERLQAAVRRAATRAGVSADVMLAEHSSQLQAGKIKARVLLLTSDADEQVPHVMVQGLIDALRGAGHPPALVHVADSLHGFYWGREGEFGSREGRGPRTQSQLREEEHAREAIEMFFRDCFSSPRT